MFSVDAIKTVKAMAQKVAAKDQTRYAIKGIQLSPYEKNDTTYCLAEATDARIAARAIVGYANESENPHPVIVDRNGVIDGCKIKADEIHVTNGEPNRVQFSGKGQTVSTDLGEGNFPPMLDVMGIHRPTLRAFIDVELLLAALEPMRSLKDPTSNRARVCIEIQDRIGLAIRITSTATNRPACSVVMPFNGSEADLADSLAELGIQDGAGARLIRESE